MNYTNKGWDTFAVQYSIFHSQPFILYTRQEAAQIKQAFWTAFGQYMAPVPPAGFEKVHWVNYKTGVKHVYFRLHAGNNHASVAIEITHPDAVSRALYYEQFVQWKNLLHNALEETWDWEPDAADETGKFISRISTTLEPVNIFNRQHWPALIGFFKPRIVKLDAFWDMVKDAFETL